MVAALEEGRKTTKMGEKEERMDFTERLELYREGEMITDDNVKTILNIIAMFREKYDIEVEEREVVQIKTVKDALDYISSLQNE